MDYEKLGLFYLGKKRDVAAGVTTDELVLYDSKHLVTHAVVVGMTGSGKTGLCIDLLEEAAIDGIPVIAIDPKGDLGNLLLTFPELAPGDFAPWIDPEEATRAGVSIEAHAASVAGRWRDGLARWGIDGTRIARLREAADLAVYTPGSRAGLPLAVMQSLDAPSEAEREDAEFYRERIGSTVTGLLGLLGIGGDPATSREHVLLAAVLDHAFRVGRSLDLPQLVEAVQRPPFDKVGVLPLESFYPASERFSLVLALNNLIASPHFAAWTEGEPLDVASLLRTREGKPRVSIVSIAHLDDAQRMFFVTLLLNQVLAWTRAQRGTTSLRAVLYMDEIFGYFPPVANPPSKKPLLTLMKQARAFGVGVVLATQNPVDLDYKGLANAGTWVLGRLQTERDKARVLEGLEGASATQGSAFDRETMERTLSALAQRQFVMHDMHAGAPFVFESRWAMSYLRGPMTREELKQLMAPRKAAALRAAAPPATNTAGGAAVPVADALGVASVPAALGAGSVPTAPTAASSSATMAPAPTAASSSATMAPAPTGASQSVAIDPAVPVCFLPPRTTPGEGAKLMYRPMVLGLARVALTDRKLDVDAVENLALLSPLTDDPVGLHWEHGTYVSIVTGELGAAPMPGVSYAPVPAVATKPKRYGAFGKELTSHLLSTRRMELWRSPSTKLVSRPGENEPAFRGRLAQAAREKRDAEVEKLRQRYAPKVAKLDERIRRAHTAVERERSEAQEASVGTAFSIGSAVLGALGGRGITAAKVGRVATATRSAQRRSRAQGDVLTAEQTVETLLAERSALEEEFGAEVAALDALAAATEVLEPVVVKPKKGAIQVVHVTLAWCPHEVVAGVVARALFV